MTPIILNLGNGLRTRDGIHAPGRFNTEKDEGNLWKEDCPDVLGNITTSFPNGIRTPDHPACGLFAIPTTLSLLLSVKYEMILCIQFMIVVFEENHETLQSA